jgi:RNA polymerase sigma-70 factor (ECF subfamily)
MSKSPADNGDPAPEFRRDGDKQDVSERDPRSGDDPAADRESWRAIFDESESGLRRFLTGKLPQTADVDDCMQLVSVAMLKNSTEIPIAARRAWLFRVAANEAARWWRNKSTTDRVLEKHADSAYRDDTSTPAIETEETVQRVNQAIENLSEDVRLIVKLRLREGMTFQAIADQLKLPLGTVLTRMRRAMQRLRSEFDSEDAD